MEIRHRQTGLTQTIDKQGFEVLQTSGHAKNFEVLSENDFTPAELSLPPKKGKATEPAGEQ